MKALRETERTLEKGSDLLGLLLIVVLHGVCVEVLVKCPSYAAPPCSIGHKRQGIIPTHSVEDSLVDYSKKSAHILTTAQRQCALCLMYFLNVSPVIDKHL